MFLNKLGSSYDFNIIKLITQRSTVVQYSHFNLMAVNISGHTAFFSSFILLLAFLDPLSVITGSRRFAILKCRVVGGSKE